MLLLALVGSSLAQDVLPVAPPVPTDVVPVEVVPKDDLDALARKLAEQQVALEDLQRQVAQDDVKRSPDVRFRLEGHLRERAFLFNHLFASQTAANGDYQDARYLQHRLLLRPVIETGDFGKVAVEVRALDGVIWGDNAGNASTALFADTPSQTNIEGRELPSLRVERAWAEVILPIGQIRFGRQTNDWGMGLLVNPGDRFDDDFGEDKVGSTNDRLLFATRPVAIIQKIAGKEDSNFPLYAVVAVDRLVEDPLVQHYGYECAPGISQESPDYDVRCDFDGDGLTDLDHGYDADRTGDQRGQDWWADQDDDVQQMLYVLAYRGTDLPWLDDGDLTGGFWIVNRTQRETDSHVWVLDGAFKLDAFGLLLEGEGIAITGKTSAITLPGSINTEEGADPLAKVAGVKGYAVRAGYGDAWWHLRLENGYASGDDNVADASFTGRSLHPDHNVGLLLYEEVISRVSAQLWTDSARGLWSGGGVYNSMYVMPTARVRPKEDLEIIAGFLTAYPDRPDGAVIRCAADDKGGCDSAPTQQATAASLGWEVDAAVKYTFKEHLLLSAEFGYARTTDRLPLEAAGLDPDGRFFTAQSRVAWQF